MSEDRSQAVPPRKESIIERHVQTIIAAILLALVLWTGNTLIDIKTDVTTLKVTAQQLKDELRAATDARFTINDWRREREIIEQRLSRIESELDWNRGKHDAARSDAPSYTGRNGVRK